jgi:hypothetical protein
VVDRAVEEALDLAGVEIDADHPLGAGGLEEVGHQSGRDRLAAFGLAVLAGIAVEGAHRGDALGRGAVRGVDHDELLHDRVVDGASVTAIVGLHDEDVGASDALGEPGPQLAARELHQVGIAELDTQVFGDLVGQGQVGAARVEGHPLGGHAFHLLL